MTRTVLAFDVGLRRTGVASGQALTATARPAALLKVSNGRHNWNEVDALIEQWLPQTIVIGQPHTQDAALKKAINRLKSHIQQIHKLPIVEIDETLSSESANQEMANHQALALKDKKRLRDQVAACLILESYFRTL